MRILIAGLPKTGTTALLYLIKGSLKNAAVSFEPRAYSAVSSSKHRKLLTKIVYTNQKDCDLAKFLSDFSNFDKYIWIARDPRDQLISAFLYAWYKAHKMPEDKYDIAFDLVSRKEAGEKLSLISIMRAIFGDYGYYHNPNYYLNQVTPFFRNTERKFYIYRYKDLIDQNYSHLSDYLSIDISGKYEVPSKFSRVARTKSYGNWRAWFEAEDVEHFKPILSEYMSLVGIPDDWELSSDRLDPELNSKYMQKLHYGDL